MRSQLALPAMPLLWLQAHCVPARPSKLPARPWHFALNCLASLVAVQSKFGLRSSNSALAQSRSCPSAAAASIATRSPPQRLPACNQRLPWAQRQGILGGVHTLFAFSHPMRPNPSVKRNANGGPPGPGHGAKAPFPWPGPGVPPSSSAYLER